jgi:hypothetical protein
VPIDRKKLCTTETKLSIIEIIRLLFEKEMDVNFKNNEGWKALYLLCRYYERENLFQIVKLLLRRGIDVNCVKRRVDRPSFGVTILQDNLILLLDYDIDVNSKTKEGCNALHFVCRQYYQKENLVEVAEFLQRNLSQLQEQRRNALHVCRYQQKKNMMDLVPLLTRHKIDNNAVGRWQLAGM